jgi:hypothetical protein
LKASSHANATSWGSENLAMATCPICRPEGLTEEEHALRCDSADTEKERRRVAFRDLCDDLGYVPKGYGVKLAPETKSCPNRRMDS